MDDSNPEFEKEIMKKIQQFRVNPKCILEQKELIKNQKKKKEFEDYINSLEKMPELIYDQNLCKIAEEELKKLSEDPDKYNKYQIGEEFQANLSKEFTKNEVALIAIEEFDRVEKLLYKIIHNESDKDKKGRIILSNKSYTHFGFGKSKEDSIILIFAKKEETINNVNNSEEEEKIELSEDENKIFNQIKLFRNNPKVLLEQKELIKNKKKRNDYEAYINSLDKMKELKLDQKLTEIAKEEIKILSDDIDNYEKIQINEEFKPKLPNEYDKKNTALIAIGEIDNFEKLLYKIIHSETDKDKKGRIILSNTSYTHLGICKSKDDDSIILIFAKKREKIDNINNEKEENQFELNEEEKNILNEIQLFRSNPKTLLDKIGSIKNQKKRSDNEEFINSLDKMEKLKLDKKLIEIAREEIKVVGEDIDNYEKFQIGESVKNEIREKLLDKNIAILVINDIDKLEDFIFKIIVNEVDKHKKGRAIISDKSYTNIGLSQYCPPENDDEKPVIIIFAKDKQGENITQEAQITNLDNNISTEENKKDKGNENISSIESKEVNVDKSKKDLNKNYPSLYFFTSLNINNNNISDIKIYNKNQIEIKDKILEHNEESESLPNKKYKLIYFKLTPNKYCSYFIHIYSKNNTIEYISSEIKIIKDCYILEHIKLYKNNRIVDQMQFTNEQILYKIIYTLKLFSADKTYMIYALERYVPLKNYIPLEDLLIIMDHFSKNNVPPLFLKDVNIIFILNQNYKVSNFNFENMFENLLTIIQREFNDDNSQTDNYKKCYLFLMEIYAWIYYKFNKEKFRELINNKNQFFNSSLSLLLSKKIIKIEDLQATYGINPENIVELAIENSSSFYEIKNIFLNFKNIIEALNSIDLNYKSIIEKINLNKISSSILWDYFTSTNTEVNLPEPVEKDDIDQIFNYQVSIIDKEKIDDGRNLIVNFTNILSKLINVHRKAQNLFKLIELKKLINHLKKEGKNVSSHEYNLEYAIHEVGFNLVMSGKLSNKEILKFIQNDTNYEQLINKKQNVFDNFNIFDEKKEGFKEFIEFKINDKFKGKNKIYFYLAFIIKLKDFDDLSVLFELFPNELDNDFIDILFKKFNQMNNYIYDAEKKEKIEKLSENMFIIIKNIVSNGQEINLFTNVIEKKFDTKTINEIYIKILLKNDDKVTEKVNEEFSRYFINKIINLNAEEIYQLIKSCSNNHHFLKKIFNNIDNYILNEDDFYSSVKSTNFQLYELFVTNGYINNENYYNTKYFGKIAKITSKLYFNIKELKIPFLLLSDLIDKNRDEFLNRLNLILTNENTNLIDLYNEVMDNLNKCKDKIFKLDKIYNYLNYFEKKASSELINKLQMIINKLRNMKINEIIIEKETEKIDYLNDLIIKSDNIRFHKSIIFMRLYEELEKEKKFNNDEYQLFCDTKNLFVKIIRKIIDFKNGNFMKIDKINIILDMIKNKEDEINKEMNFISEEFNDFIITNNFSIDLIKENLINFSYLIDLKNYLNGYLFIISFFSKNSENTNYETTDFSEKLLKLTNELSEDFIKCESVENAYKILEEFGVNFKNKNIDDFNEFIVKVNGKTNELKFCIGKTDEEIKNLNEFLQDRQSASGNLLPDDFNDFIGCKKYVNEVIYSEFSNDKELDIILKNEFKSIKNLIIKFNNYLEKYGEIKELYDDSIYNKSEITKSSIQKLMKYSKIIIIKKGNNFEFKGLYEEDNEKKNKKDNFDLKYLLQLKNKALFSQNTIIEDINYREQITKFNDIVLKIYNLSEIIKNLILSGYPYDFSINLEIKNDSLINSDNKYTTVKDLLRNYDSLFDKFDREITKSYKNKTYLRFLYGPLFLSVLEKIKNENHPIEFLLKSISNGKIKNLPNSENFKIAEDANFSEIFNVINRYLEECFLENKLSISRILVQNKLLIRKEGLYRVAVFSEIEKNLVSLYKQLTGHFPLSNTVLFCNEFTSNEEIKAFFYLSFRSDYPALFCLLGIEKLDSEKRVKTIKLINKFNQKYKEDIRSCIVVLYLKNTEIEKTLTKIIPDENEILLNEKEGELFFDSNNIEIYCSARAGFGKSEEIKSKIKKEKKNYCYFPLGGNFKREKIIQRLIDFNLKQNKIDNYAIHFDLSETNLTELMQEILFKILILKKLDINEKIFYFGDELKIKIELPNGFYNYLDKFPILKLFKSRIYLKELLPMNIPKQIKAIKYDDIQIVCNTLLMYKKGKIGEHNLNFDSAKLLNDKECQNIINEFLQNDKNNYNYYQKMIFVKLLAKQFTMFKDYFVLDPDKFDNVEQKNAIIKCRKEIIKCILDSTLYFSKGPYDNLIKSQMISQESDEVFNEEKSNERALKSLETTRENISFENLPKSLFFFNDDLSTFTAITSLKDSEVYKKFYDLIYKLSTGEEKKDLPDYSKGDHKFYLKQLKNILGLPEMLFDEQEILELNRKIREETKEELDSSIYDEDINEDRKLYMEKLAKKNGNYIYTRDNFIKTVIILLKIKASIPVILMGETGCGKTSLLKMLSIFMNKGSEKMKTKNIHTGTDEEDIINFMKKDVIENMNKEKEEELKQIMEKFDSLDKIYKDKKKREIYEEEQRNKLNEKKVWVFFDELNTCNSMGLIAEIMCKRTMHGEPLPQNLIFLGAVNPYRTMTGKMRNSGLTYQTNNSKTNLLVYTVNPLPHTLMNFIFNFSDLGKNEEREYIKSMISQNFSKFYSKKEDKNIKKDEDDKEEKSDSKSLEEYQKLLSKALECICKCHDFIREKYDISSVSLREIRRFNIFFNFFQDYLKNKSKYKLNYVEKFDLLIGTLNITLYLCYYLRISDKKIREELANILNKSFEGKTFIEMPEKEIDYITEQFNIDYEKGIALNRSLKENLFTSFVCIINRIPLIIVGKPGEGKSLTIQTINQTMKGIYSKSPLFQEYPQLYIYTYQGSETSTSQGIIETFDKARDYAKTQLIRLDKDKDEKKEKFISMVFLDEMGLAERSPNNPLKAIHSQLEYDDNEFKIAFVGISNWKIDASKMNRCLTLSKPDPDKEDLISTAHIIAKALDSSLSNNHKTLIEALANSYYEYKKIINLNKIIENFHGNRDFYYLIKCAMRELIKERDNINELNKEKILTKIGLMSLTRNFGGLETSLKDIKKIFKDKYVNYNEDESYNYNILDCIKDNLNDYNSRFLMLVANSTIIKYLENVLESQNKNYMFLTGSQFQQDKKAAEKGGGYSEDLLNKIQYQMSKDSVLILKNLEVIYPSLYELFNQNYIKIGNKYFSKISFAHSKASTEVNKNFRVILLITQQQLDKMKVDPPLLNRFEKQIVSFKDSLNQNQIVLAENITKFFDKIRTFNGNEKKLVYNLPDLMFNCNRDEIEGLIYKISNNNKDKNVDNKFIEKEIFLKLAPTFCQDIIASIKYSGIISGDDSERVKSIIEIYKQREINNFSQFLEKMKKDKNVIYTFSNIYDIFITEEKKIKYREIIVENINSENKLEEEMSKFYEDNNNYLIFRFVEKDLNKMNHLSYLVNNFLTKYRQQNFVNIYKNEENMIDGNLVLLKKKKIIFLVHLTRKYINKNNSLVKNKIYFSTEELISNLDDSYDILFIDNLRSERNDFINILEIKNPKDLVTSLINCNKFLDKNLNRIISYFDYKFVNKFDTISLKDYTNIILTNLINDKESKSSKFLRKLLIDIALKNIDQSNMIPKVYTSKIFQNTDVDFFQVLETYVSSEFSNKLLTVVNAFEKRGIFYCFFLKENNKNIIENEFLLNQIKSELEKINYSLIARPIAQSRGNKINLITNLSIPCIYNYLNTIRIEFIVKEKIDIKYINNENTLRPRKELENENNVKQEYLDKYQSLLDGLKEQFYLIQNIKEIFQSNSEEIKDIKKAFYCDSLLIYCIEIYDKFSNKNDKPISPIKLIEIILQLRFNIINNDNYQDINIKFIESYFDTKEDFTIENLSEVILYLQSYKTEIIILSEVYCLLTSYFPNTFDKAKEILESKIIKTEISKRNPSYKKKVNEVFYLIMESLLKSIYMNEKQLFDMEIFNFFSFFDSLTSIEATLNKMNQKLLLYSNELYSLRNLLLVYQIFKEQLDVRHIMIKKVLCIIGKDNEYLQNNDFDSLKNNILKIKEIISYRFGANSDILANYMINLLKQQYRKIDNENYKFELLKMAFENDKLIQRSLFFINSTINIPYPILNNSKNNKNLSKYCFETDEECAKFFLDFINFKDDNILSFFESIKNETFDQVMLYHFEMQAYNYFNNIIIKYKDNRPDPNNINIKSKEECEELLLYRNLLYLYKALEHIDNCYKKEGLEEKNLNNLGKIFAIAYVKLYIKYLAEIYKYNKTKISFIKITDLISSKEIPTRNMVKIFFFKNYYQYFENYFKFNDSIKKDNEFPFRNDYLNIIENKESKFYILNFNFLPVKNIEQFKKLTLEFVVANNNKFENLNKIINKEFILNNGFDVFFCLCVNNLLSYYYSNERDKNVSNIINLKNEFHKISNTLELPSLCINLFEKILDIKQFIKKILSKIGGTNDLTQQQFEIILYSLRFILKTSQSKNKNNFYYNLLTRQCKSFILNNYIIGTLPFNNIFLKSYYSLNILMHSPCPYNVGYYICTCGQYYTLGNCTCPTEKRACLNPKCKLQIGGTGHRLLGKDEGQTDHWRVILEEKDKKITMYSETAIKDGRIPCMFLDEYKRKYVDKYINEQPKGIKKEDADNFSERSENPVRTLDELSFRILNYILYSHLFFSNILDNFNDNEMKLYTHGNFTCFRMIEKNWEIIETILKEKGVNNIKSFMNIIFDKFGELLGKAENMSTIDKRQEFESEIRDYFEHLINNKEEYTKMENNYNNYNEIIKGSNYNSLIEILSENYSPFENIYDKENYPNMEMFLISKYANMNDLEICLRKQPDYAKNYCLLNQVFAYNEEYRLIENIENLNRLVDYLYKKYNNKIERNKAKEIKIKDCFENENIEEINKDLLQPYIESWNKIKSKCRKFSCKPEMPELTITTEHTLNHFLPDDGELYGGMYLASAYRNIIDWQNNFIDIIINSISDKSLLKSYLSQLNQTIHVQEATKENLAIINQKIYNRVKDMIMQYSMRDIFINNKIDFREFKRTIKYDFDAMESELARIILPAIKKFYSDEEDEPIKFISYLYETFRSRRSSIITNYNRKYPSRELNDKEKQLLYLFVKDKKNQSTNFTKDILSSCQILIDFIQKENFNKNELIYTVIKKLPKYIEINDSFKSFFILSVNENEKTEYNMFSINTLLNIYNLIELICWNQFKENLNEQYQMHLTDEIKKEIKEYFDEEIGENNMIKKQDIANAVRRLISRYLSGKRGDTDISEYKQLYDYIQREDLWRTELLENDNFETELFNIFEKLKNIALIVIECNETSNKCDKCNKSKKQGIENPCPQCDNCKWGLRIGHALEFFELINEEIFNADNYKEKEKEDNSEDFNENEIVTINEINTDSNKLKENGENNIINNEAKNDKKEQEKHVEEKKDLYKPKYENDYKFTFRKDDDDEDI